jgi:hypothetical protein
MEYSMDVMFPSVGTLLRYVQMAENNCSLVLFGIDGISAKVPPLHLADSMFLETSRLDRLSECCISPRPWVSA